MRMATEIEFSEAELDDFADDVDWLKAVLSAYTEHLWRGQGGKLKDAAVYWASGGKIVEDKTQDDAAAFGIKLPEAKGRRVRGL